MQDNMPVSWSPFMQVESLEVLAGDLVMTSRTAGCASVDGLLYEDVRMHTQLRVSEASFVDAGFYLYNSSSGMWWGGAIAGSDYSQQRDIPPNSLFIWTFDPGWRILAASPTTLDPVQSDVELRFDAIGDTLTLTGWAEAHPSQTISAQASNRSGGAIGPYINDSVTPAPLTTAFFRSFAVVPEPLLQAGDADQDFDFDQFDLVEVLAAGKYLSGKLATWGEGDWNGAPGGSPGNPPPGDGIFDRLDIIKALATGLYMSGPHTAVRPDVERREPVPEPPSIVLMVMVSIALATRQVPTRRAAKPW
jgi:hypothetical protein